LCQDGTLWINWTAWPDMQRIAFYPCCGKDILPPASALTGIADEIIYCDISRSLRDDPLLVGCNGPRRTFWRMDIREALDQIARIDVFFYRRDGTSEGGSGIFVLGRDIMPLILAKMTAEPGLFITDGSNSRGGTFRKMQRNSGLTAFGKHIKKRPEQRFEALGMLEFDVRSNL
jgi:hypothetical protein